MSLSRVVTHMAIDWWGGPPRRDAPEPQNRNALCPMESTRSSRSWQPTPADKPRVERPGLDPIQLNERTLVYIERKLVERRADLQAKHEQAKARCR